MSPLRGLLRRLYLAAAALLPAGCTTYEVARMEFDSITGFDLARDGEPERVAYRHDVARWPWAVRQFEGTGFDWFLAVTSGARPGPREIDNPAEMLRERMQALTELAVEDFGRTADLAHRLLWVVAREEAALDQIIALSSLGELLAAMQVDPLQVPFASPDPVADLDATEAALRSLEALAPAARAGRALDDAERRRYLGALRGLGRRPSGSAAAGRRVIRVLLRCAATEPDAELRAATRQSLADAIACEAAQAIRIQLASTSADVREAALRTLHRLSGPRVVPFSLRALASRPGGGGSWRYDPDEGFRRTWVRMCAQLPPELVFASYDGGPQPIEFLYDTATRDESEGLRIVALDALSRALGRPVSLDRAWADAWWTDLSLERDGRAPAGVGPEREGR
jgi:hypothetical protein